MAKTVSALSRARKRGYDARIAFERRFNREYKLHVAWFIVLGMMIGALVVFLAYLLNT